MEKTTGRMTKKAVRSVCGLLAAGLLAAAVMPMHAAADEEEAQPQQITEAEAGKVTFSTDYHKARRNLDVYSVYYKYRFGRDHCRA